MGRVEREEEGEDGSGGGVWLAGRMYGKGEVGGITREDWGRCRTWFICLMASTDDEMEKYRLGEWRHSGWDRRRGVTN